jgi:signal transduction histidine kinase
VVDSPYVPTVVLTDFRLFGRPVAVGADSPLSKSIGYASTLSLSHDKNVFSLEFSALSYFNPATNRYRYKLEGLDRQWHEVGSNQRLVTYTTLPAGRYTFRVQGATSRGAWSEPGLELPIEILPPWWSTWWFRAVCLAFSVTLVWAFHQWRLRQVEARARLQMEERVSERARIARELHDTLLQSFQGLILKFQRARNLLPAQPEQAMQSLETALDRAERAIMEGRDAIHDIRTSTPVDRDLLGEITALGEELARTDGRSTSPRLQVIVEGRPNPVHPLVRKEILKIVGEALRNAHAHANARNIEAELRYEEKMLRVRIRDDGIGVNQEHMGAIGRAGHYGLCGMRERAAQMGAQLDVWTEQGAGTEIELSVPDLVAYKLDDKRTTAS